MSFYRKHEGLILGAISVVFVLAVWEFVWDMHWISPLFMSGPREVVAALREAEQHGTLLSDMAYSGKNFAVGRATFPLQETTGNFACGSSFLAVLYREWHKIKRRIFA